MKKIAILALVAVIPTFSTAMVFALPPLQTNSSIVKMSLNEGGTANIIVRQKGTNGLESLHQWLYSCRSGAVVTGKTAAVDLLIKEITPFPERALQIKAAQVAGGNTNSRNWIVTERCDLIPVEAFGAIVPKAISPDGKVVVGTVSDGFALSKVQPEPPYALARTSEHVFTGQKFQSLTAYARTLDSERWQSIWQRIHNGVPYFIAVVLIALFASLLYRNPPVKHSG